MNTLTFNTTVQLCLSISFYVRSSPSKFFTINGVLACVVNGVLAVTGTLVNSLVIVAFWKSSLLRTKAPFFLIMVLSITDLAVTLFVHPTFIIAMVKQLTGTGDCVSKTIYLTATTFFPGLSGLTLSVINFERYLAIVYPFAYQRCATKQNLFAVTVIFWLSWVPVTIIPFFAGSKLQSKLMIFYATLACVTTVFVYAKIFQIARRKRRLEPTRLILSFSSQMKSMNCLDSGDPVYSRRERAKLTEFMKDVKLAKTFILIVVCTQVCYIPNLVFQVYSYTHRGVMKTVTLLMAGPWAMTFITLNSTLNSLIFCWKNSQLRKEILRIVKCAI